MYTLPDASGQRIGNPLGQLYAEESRGELTRIRWEKLHGPNGLVHAVLFATTFGGEELVEEGEGKSVKEAKEVAAQKLLLKYF